MTSMNAPVIWRYATLGGASVVVTRDDDAARGWAADPRDAVFQWRCLGCGDNQDQHYDDRFLREGKAQNRANGHAAECRAMPLATQAVAPSPTAKLLAEVAGVRRELAGAVEAMRELVDRVADASNELSNVTDAIGDVGATEVLSDIARAIESLGDAVERDEPRRWRDRFLPRQSNRRRAIESPGDAERDEPEVPA